jgi:hypothetical protein
MARPSKSRPAEPKSPRKLGVDGARLWASIHEAYAIDDAGGLELLLSACQALDRAEACRAAVDKDGEMITGPNGARDHPLLKHELASRAFVVRTLQRLGLDVEPVRPIGRPPGL